MILVADVGNSNITFGLYKKKNKVLDYHVKTESAYDVHTLQLTLKRSPLYRKRRKVKVAVFASVHSQVDGNLRQAIISTFPNVRNKSNLQLKFDDLRPYLKFKYDKPESIGIDRLLNFRASISKYGADLLIIDLGTAATFCLVNSKKQFSGGVIAPGPKMLTNAMADYTDALPLVKWRKPKSWPGDNTKHSIQHGTYTAYWEMILGIIRKFKKRYMQEFKKDLTLIVTGGFGSYLLPKIKKSETVHDPDLTLDGLLYFARKIKKHLEPGQPLLGNEVEDDEEPAEVSAGEAGTDSRSTSDKQSAQAAGVLKTDGGPSLIIEEDGGVGAGRGSASANESKDITANFDEDDEDDSDGDDEV